MHPFADLHRRLPTRQPIAERALEWCRLGRGARLLDIGCGGGETVRRLRQRLGCEIFGIDRLPARLDAPGRLVCAAAEALPWPAAVLDAVLLECSFSLMADRGRVLRECRRVLRPGGRLILADLFARGRAVTLGGCLGRLDTRAEIEAILAEHGFAIELWEDYSTQLQAVWGQLILEHGLESLCRALGADADSLRLARCGYGLFIARPEVA